MNLDRVYYDRTKFDPEICWTVDDMRRVEDLMQECGLEVVRSWLRTVDEFVLEASFLFTLGLYFGLALKVEEERVFLLSKYDKGDIPRVLLWPVDEACRRLVCSDDLANLVRGEQFVCLNVDTFERIRRMLL
jgi:hypothetical protein